MGLSIQSKITPEIFFKGGSILFAIIGMCQLINLFYYFGHNGLFNNLISISQIFFSFLTSGFFLYLLNQNKSQINQAELSSYDEIKKAIDKIEDEDDNKHDNSKPIKHKT